MPEEKPKILIEPGLRQVQGGRVDSTNAVPTLAASIVSIMHKNMMLDPGDLNKKRVKKDVLWKPLLREFRGFYRSQINHFVDLREVVNSFASDMKHAIEA